MNESNSQNGWCCFSFYLIIFNTMPNLILHRSPPYDVSTKPEEKTKPTIALIFDINELPDFSVVVTCNTVQVWKKKHSNSLLHRVTESASNKVHTEKKICICYKFVTHRIAKSVQYIRNQARYSYGGNPPGNLHAGKAKTFLQFPVTCALLDFSESLERSRLRPPSPPYSI